MSADKMLEGSMAQLPPKLLPAIRVFVSSTFTDMAEERNIFMNDAVPEMRKYCHDRGFDFEVVDMRWGVREDASDDHTATDICLKEIENCQQMSLGPNFILFVGDKYGSRPLPSAIPVSEFRHFRRIAFWHGLKFETVEKWYLLDTNSVPHVYHIQPVSVLLPYYNNMNPVHETNRLVHQQNWECDERQMKSVFRKIALIAVARGKITEEAAAKYFMSVTELEIEKGIYNYPSVKDRIIYLERSFININMEDKIAKRFIDLTTDGELDEEARSLRNKLKNEKLPGYVPADQTVKNTVSWTSAGIDPTDDEHGRYLTMMRETLKTHLVHQIDKCLAEAAEARMDNVLMLEVFAHHHFCAGKCECFFGQESLLNTVYNLMNMEVESTVKSLQNDNKKEENIIEKDDKQENTEGEEVEEGENRENEKKEETQKRPESNENGEEKKDEIAEKEAGEGEDTAKETEETPDKNSVDGRDESDPPSGKDAQLGQIYELYKKQGIEPPTVAIGDHDKSSDPNRK